MTCLKRIDAIKVSHDKQITKVDGQISEINEQEKDDIINQKKYSKLMEEILRLKNIQIDQFYLTYKETLTDYYPLFRSHLLTGVAHTMPTQHNYEEQIIDMVEYARHEDLFCHGGDPPPHKIIVRPPSFLPSNSDSDSSSDSGSESDTPPPRKSIVRPPSFPPSNSDSDSSSDSGSDSDSDTPPPRPPQFPPKDIDEYLIFLDGNGIFRSRSAQDLASKYKIPPAFFCFFKTDIKNDKAVDILNTWDKTQSILLSDYYNDYNQHESFPHFYSDLSDEDKEKVSILIKEKWSEHNNVTKDNIRLNLRPMLGTEYISNPAWLKKKSATKPKFLSGRRKQALGYRNANKRKVESIQENTEVSYQAPGAETKKKKDITLFQPD